MSAVLFISAQNLPKIGFPNLMLLMNITAVAATFMLLSRTKIALLQAGLQLAQKTTN